MIGSAEEYLRLLGSGDRRDMDRTVYEEAPVEVWFEVVRGHPDRRRWAAHNKTIPIEVLEWLSDDPDWQVRASVAVKRKLTPALFWKLARDPVGAVRADVAYNRKAPSDVLRALCGDREARIREVAAERLEERAEAARRRGAG